MVTLTNFLQSYDKIPKQPNVLQKKAATLTPSTTSSASRRMTNSTLHQPTTFIDGNLQEYVNCMHFGACN